MQLKRWLVVAVLLVGCSGTSVSNDLGGDALSPADRASADPASADHASADGASVDGAADAAAADASTDGPMSMSDGATPDGPSGDGAAVDQMLPPADTSADASCKKCANVANLLIMGGGMLPDLSAVSQFCAESQRKLLAIAGCVVSNCDACVQGMAVSFECISCVGLNCNMELLDCANDR